MSALLRARLAAARQQHGVDPTASPRDIRDIADALAQERERRREEQEAGRGPR